MDIFQLLFICVVTVFYEVSACHARINNSFLPLPPFPVYSSCYYSFWLLKDYVIANSVTSRCCRIFTEKTSCSLQLVHQTVEHIESNFHFFFLFHSFNVPTFQQLLHCPSRVQLILTMVRMRSQIYFVNKQWMKRWYMFSFCLPTQCASA